MENTDSLCETASATQSAEDIKRRRKESRAKFLERIRRELESVKHQLAFTIPEAALVCGRSPTWGYRKVYSGEWRVTNRDGRLLIPASEIAHFLSGVEKYNPAPKNGGEGNGHTQKR